VLAALALYVAALVVYFAAIELLLAEAAACAAVAGSPLVACERSASLKGFFAQPTASYRGEFVLAPARPGDGNGAGGGATRVVMHGEGVYRDVMRGFSYTGALRNDTLEGAGSLEVEVAHVVMRGVWRGNALDRECSFYVSRFRSADEGEALEEDQHVVVFEGATLLCAACPGGSPDGDCRLEFQAGAAARLDARFSHGRPVEGRLSLRTGDVYLINATAEAFSAAERDERGLPVRTESASSPSPPRRDGLVDEAAEAADISVHHAVNGTLTLEALPEGGNALFVPGQSVTFNCTDFACEFDWREGAWSELLQRGAQGGRGLGLDVDEEEEQRILDLVTGSKLLPPSLELWAAMHDVMAFLTHVTYVQQLVQVQPWPVGLSPDKRADL
jgi:hypothetical protein